MATANSYFEIKQMSGPKRTLRLSGRALPFVESMSFGGIQRTEKTLYGGCPDASIQVQGPDELDWSPNGMWSDRYLTGNDATGTAQLTTGSAASSGSGTQLQTALAIAQILDLIRREGQLVRVAWDVEVRYGILKKFDYKPRPTMDRLEWSADFEWVGRSDQPALPSLPQRIGVLDFASRLARANQLLQSLTRDINELPSQFPLDFGALSGFRESADALGGLRNSAYNAVAAYTQQLQSATDTARSVLTLGSQSITAGIDLADLTQRESYRQLTGAADLSTITAGQYVAAAGYARRVGDQGLSYVQTGQEFINTAQQSFVDDILAVVQVREGDDLRSIALDKYQNAEQWRDIAIYNGLRGPGDVVAGESVYVPRIN